MDVTHIKHEYRKDPVSLAMTLICCVELLEGKVNVTVQNALHFRYTKPMEAHLFLYWQRSPKLSPILFINIIQHFQ